jgi:hypothetical protein
LLERFQSRCAEIGLQDHTLGPLLLLAGEQRGARGMFKHFSDALVGLGGAFKVFYGTNLLANLFGLGSKIELADSTER